MKNLLKIFLPLVALWAVPVFAANPFDIQFPIAALGNCGSMEECKTFCDNPANASVCLSWAKENGLAAEEPRPADDRFAERAREVLTESAGPGGCRSFEECDAFCSQPQNADTCFAFAKEHDLAPSEELRKVERRAGPGGCKSQQECDTFCRNPDNAETCLNFAVSEGKITQEEADFMVQQMKEFGRPGEPGRMGPPKGPEHRGPQPPQIDVEKAKKLLETEGGPGGCKSMEECDTFCNTPGNEEVCMQFAVERGLMPKEEVERAKKMMNIEGPGGCRGKECETYCNNPDHGEECIDFAVRQGFMDAKEAEQAKKFSKLAKEPGPGGCVGRESCDAFCSKPENGDACFAFAKEHGLVSQDDIQRMEKGKIIRGKLEQQGGPGGCKGETECRSYCEDASHFDECVAFAVDAGMMKPDEARQRLQNFTDIEMRPMQPMEAGRPVQMMPFNPPAGTENRMNVRMEQFEQFRQEFERRGEYCADPAHKEECSRGPQPSGMPPADMRPPEGMMPPRDGGPDMPPPPFQGRPEGAPDYGSFRQPEGRSLPNMPMPPEGFRQFTPPANMQLPEGIIRPSEGTQYNSFMPPADQYRSMQPPEGMMPPPPGGEPPSVPFAPQMPQTMEQFMQPMTAPAPAPAPSEPAPAASPTSFLPYSIGSIAAALVSAF